MSRSDVRCWRSQRRLSPAAGLAVACCISLLAPGCGKRDSNTPALVSLAISPASPSLAQGASLSLTATGIYSDLSQQDLTATVTWSSSAEGVATVSNAAGKQGQATGLAAGTATITATLGLVSGSTALTVTAATLASLEVTPTNPSIALGTTQALVATGIFTDGSHQDLTASASWSSSADGVATVSNAAGQQGLATGVAEGTATITATLDSISGSTTLTVTAATLVSLAVTPTNPSLAKGTTLDFAATGTYSDGSHQDLTSSATWSSSADGVATVSNATGERGRATAVAEGAASITATLGDLSDSTTLTVTAATLVSLAVTPSNPSIAKGTTEAFAATGTFTDGSTQDLTASVTWSSSPANVATISNAAGQNGLATAVAMGSTTITAALGPVSGTTTLTVTAATLVSLAVTPSSPSLAKGTTLNFVAAGTYSDGSLQILTSTATWSSSAQDVATVSNAAGQHGLATAVAEGDATITATLGTLSATATLTVTAAALVSLAVTPSAPTIATGTTQAFVATGTFTDGSLQILTTSATWSSSAEDIATVSNAAGQNGLATAVAAGSAAITATRGSVSGSTTLTVKLALGESCGSSDACLLGFCVGDLCCDSACSGPCASCSVSGSVGTCVASTCEAAAPVCNGDGSCSAACDTGCLSGDVCYPIDAEHCGLAGGACTTSCSSATPFCGSSGSCVGCRTSDDCSGVASLCDAATSTCVEPACSGYSWAGLCWYLSASLQRCSELCTTHGGDVQPARFWEGRDWGECTALLVALGTTIGPPEQMQSPLQDSCARLYGMGLAARQVGADHNPSYHTMDESACACAK